MTSRVLIDEVYLRNSGSILREIRQRMFTLVKNPPKHDVDIPMWKAEMEMLLHAEIVYSRPEIIPVSGTEQMQVRP